MLKKISEFLVVLLQVVKRLIRTPHSLEAEQDSDFNLNLTNSKFKNFVLNYVNDYGISDFVLLISALLTSISAFLICLFLVSMFFL